MGDGGELLTFLQEHEVHLQEVEQTLEQLGRLARAIRNSTRRSREQRSQEFGMEADLGPTHNLFRACVQSLYPLADRSLQDLLSTSMFDRHTRLTLLETRRTHLATRHVPQPQRTRSLVHEEQDDSGELIAGTPSKNTVQPGLPRSEIYDQSIGPSSFDTRVFRKRFRDLGVPDLDTNRTSSVLINQSSYPLPPRVGRKELMLCEWCAEPLNSSDLDPFRWRYVISRYIAEGLS